MTNRARALTVVCGLGFALCLFGFVHSVTRYLSLSSASSPIEAMRLEADAALAIRSAAELKDPRESAVIADALSQRRENYLALHGLLVEVVENEKKAAITDGLLWIGAAGIFFVILVGARHRPVTQTTTSNR